VTTVAGALVDRVHPARVATPRANAKAAASPSVPTRNVGTMVASVRVERAP